MLSRIAYAIYWMSRYIERAENVARFIEVTMNLALERRITGQNHWLPLVETTGDRELFFERYGAATQDNVLRFLTFDSEYPNSIYASLKQARENARAARPAISREMWQQVNDAYMLVKSTAEGELGDDIYSLHEKVNLACITVAGVTDATLSRDEIWHWFNIGQKLERADKTSRILDVKYFMLLPKPSDVGSSSDQVMWASLLSSASALQAYRQQHQQMGPGPVSEFLVLNPEFPRSLAFCVARLDDSVRAIQNGGSVQKTLQRYLGQLRAELSYGEIDIILENGLHQYLDNLQTRLNEIDDLLFENFFALPI